MTLELQLKIERIQKTALSLILGHEYINYENALKLTNLKRLSTRRDEICLKFVSKNLKSESPFWEIPKKSHNTRSGPNLVQEIQCRTKSYFMSSVPFLARHYNNHLKKKRIT